MAGKKKKKKKSPFAPTYPSQIGTPTEHGGGIPKQGGPFPLSPANSGSPYWSTSPPSAPSAGPSMGASAERLPGASLQETALARLRTIFTEDAVTVDPTWQGSWVGNPLQVNRRQGEPTISGPGFDDPDSDVDSDSDIGKGIYDPRKSPGIGLKTSYGWRVWNAALDLIAKDPTMEKSAVLMAAMNRVGMDTSQIDPSEARLIEMGIEWYLKDPGSLAAKRAMGMGPGADGPGNAAT